MSNLLNREHNTEQQKQENTNQKKFHGTYTWQRNSVKEENIDKYLHTGIISSKYHQSSDIFKGPGQGLQCVANCVLSLIYDQHKNSKFWQQLDIKNILTSGNILYNSIGKTTKLLVSEVPKYIKLYNFIYHIQEKTSVIGNIFIENLEFNCVPFTKVEDIIVKYKYCIVIVGEYAISIVCNNNIFYLFDPHSQNTHGMPDVNGGSIVLKLNEFRKLCSYIHKMSKYLKADTYELTPITITKYQQQESDQKIISNTQIFKEEKIKKIDPNQKYDNKSNNILNNVHFVKTNKRKLQYSIEEKPNKN